MNEKRIFYLISSYVKIFFCGNHVHAFMKIKQHCYLENFVDVKWMKMHDLQFMILFMTIPVKRRENLLNTSSCTYHNHNHIIIMFFMNEPLFSLIYKFTNIYRLFD